MFAGTPIASSASSVSGISVASGATEPAVFAAIRNVARWPTTATVEASTMRSQLPRASTPSRTSALAVRNARAEPRLPAAGQHPDHQHRAEPDRQHDRGHGRHGRAHRRREREEHDERHPELHDLAGGPLPHHGADAAADVAGLPPVADRAVHVAEHPARQRRVQEDGPVAVRDRGTQRQPHAQALGDEVPAPGAGHRGHHADAERTRERPAVDQAQRRPGTDRRPTRHSRKARMRHPGDRTDPGPGCPVCLSGRLGGGRLLGRGGRVQLAHGRRDHGARAS